MSVDVNNLYTMNFDNGKAVIKGFKINGEDYNVIISNTNFKFSEDQWKDAGARTALLEKIHTFIHKGLEESKKSEFLQGTVDKIRFVYDQTDSQKMSTKLFLSDKAGECSYEMGVFDGIDAQMQTLDQMLRGESFSAQSFANKPAAAAPVASPTPPKPPSPPKVEAPIPVAKPVPSTGSSPAPSLWNRFGNEFQRRLKEAAMRRELESAFPGHKEGIKKLIQYAHGR